jgi:hypothetical protein
MAKVYITEHPFPRYHMGSPLPVVSMPPIAEQVITSSGTSGQTSAFNADTKLVCIHTDGIVSIKFGPNPTATTSTRRLAANSTEYFEVAQGDKLAVITNT